MGVAAGFWPGRLGPSYNATVSIIFVCLYLITALNNKAFAIETILNVREGVFRSSRAVVLSTIGVAVTAFALKQGEHISRLVFGFGDVAGLILLVIFRFANHTQMVFWHGTSLHSEVLIVDGRTVESSEGAFVLDVAEIGFSGEMRDPIMLDRIGRLLKFADRVIVACPPERRRDWAMVLKGANIHGEIVSDELTSMGPLGTGKFGAGSTIVVSSGSLDIRQRLIKRVIDLAFSFVALFALAPILGLVAIAIRLESNGPILFVQDRVGRGNRLFLMYKFRSMFEEESDKLGARSTSRNDRRVTRVGKLIRASSIDELPQLFNILKGDMSIVGPRPHAIGSTAGDIPFWQVDERYLHRHACKPGLTGLAQIRGFRGATHKESDLSNRLQADLEYISGWTVWRDLSIVFSTLRVIVHRNAY